MLVLITEASVFW